MTPTLLQRDSDNIVDSPDFVSGLSRRWCRSSLTSPTLQKCFSVAGEQRGGRGNSYDTNVVAARQSGLCFSGGGHVGERGEEGGEVGEGELQTQGTGALFDI